MNDLNNKLPNLARQHSTLETLIPVVRKRVEALKVIQSHCDELELKFVEEIVALEEKYQKLYKSLYTKRYELVNGIVEPEGVKSENALKHEEGDQEKGEGVPQFWLTTMKTNEILAKKINKRDEEALKYLEDIKCRDFDISKSFKLYFFFRTNPFFKNLVLKKTYDMYHVDEEGNLATAIGTDIEWYPGKCLTHEILKKPKMGSKYKNPITKTRSCDSFFLFFRTPEVLEDEYDFDEYIDDEEFQDRMDQDYLIGLTIRDKIIPHAVCWFTGEAAQGDD